jgi:PAS domain S-box-containing protein
MERRLLIWSLMPDGYSEEVSGVEWSLLEALPEAVLVTDERGRVVTVNAQAERLFGWARDELRGELVEVLVPAVLRAAHARQRTRCANSPNLGMLKRGGSLRAVRRDGEQLDVDVHLAHHSSGGRRYVIATVRDRSRERKLEAEQELLARELCHAQKMECVGRLSAGIAHDLNNLLCVVMGISSLLLEGQPDGPFSDDLKNIEDATRRAADLSQQLLAFSRKQEPSARTVALGSVVELTAGILSRVIQESVKVTTALPKRPLYVRADPVQLEQVLLNLAINARDAMPDGGMLSFELTSFDSEGRTSPGPAGLAPGAYAKLTVRDTGSGMTPETVARAFEPFFTTKGPGNGTGLGLSTVGYIVEQSGGRIVLRSELGRGTEFDIYWPSVPAPEHSETVTRNYSDAAEMRDETPPRAAASNLDASIV